MTLGGQSAGRPRAGDRGSTAKCENAVALERTLTALSDLGRLEQVDEALVALCRSTAAAVDASPGRAGLVKEYRECLVLLGGLGSGDSDDFSELIARIGGTSVGDSPEG